jgi:hypothetical protein
MGTATFSDKLPQTGRHATKVQSRDIPVNYYPLCCPVVTIVLCLGNLLYNEQAFQYEFSNIVNLVSKARKASTTKYTVSTY